MKLEYEKTQVFFKDKETKDQWSVTFKGVQGSKDNPAKGIVYKNDEYIATYNVKFGHANKTRALRMIQESK